MAASLVGNGPISSVRVIAPVRAKKELDRRSSCVGLSSAFREQALAISLRPSSSASRLTTRSMATENTVVEKLGVRVESHPSESHLSELGVRSWPKWGCPPSKFPWTYSDTETCYLLKGRVKVYAEGSSEFVEISAGDLVVFPKGMSCTWEVSETVDKHYKFS